MILAHSGRSLAPHDLWSAWNLDPLLLATLVLAGWAYRRGSGGLRGAGNPAWRERSFDAALFAIGIALVSPLEPLAGVLASAHMVQHVLILLVAAPLLALSSPFTTLLRGAPLVVRRTTARWVRRLGLTRVSVRTLKRPVALWMLHVGTLWFWHASVPYEAALENEIVHIVEHATFLVTGVLFWRVIIGSPAWGRVSYGFSILLIFVTAMQSVFLSALLTFAQTPWYSSYAATTGQWGLTPVADQQLAGVIMWIPAGLLYVGVALGLLVAWVRGTEKEEDLPQALTPARNGEAVRRERSAY